MMEPKEIIDGLLTAAQEHYTHVPIEGVQEVAVVAYNPREDFIEPGVLLEAPEDFVTLLIRGPAEPQWNLKEARKVLYPQIREKVK